MQRIINKPEKVVDEMLLGFAKAHPNTVDSRSSVVTRRWCSCPGLGATPVMELYTFYNKVAEVLSGKGTGVYRSYVGNFFIFLKMAGVMPILLKVDDKSELYRRSNRRW